MLAILMLTGVRAAPPPEADVQLRPPMPTETMIQQLIGQTVLDHPPVQQYLHAELATNVPLAVWALPALALGAAKLRVGGQPVRVVATEAEARFVFRTLERQETSAQLRIGVAIPPEGVQGTVDVELRDYVWSVVATDLHER